MIRARFVLEKYALIFPLLFAASLGIQVSRTDAGRDAAILWVGAVNPDLGRSIYHPLPEPGVFQQQSVYNYPPPLAAALRPLARLGYRRFAVVWQLVLAIGFWVFAAACGRIWSGTWALRPALMAGALVFFVPGVIHSWNMANADVLVWAVVAWALATHGSERGAALASGTALKVLPVWGLLWALRERRVWRGALAATLVALAVMLLGLGVSGAWRESVTWLTRVAPSLSQGEFWKANTSWSFAGHSIPDLSPGNLSLSFLPVQLFANPDTPLPGFVRAWLLFASIGGPLLVGFLLRKKSYQIAAVIAASVVLSPICRLNYVPLLVPCALAFLRGRKEP